MFFQNYNLKLNFKKTFGKCLNQKKKEKSQNNVSIKKNFFKEKNIESSLQITCNFGKKLHWLLENEFSFIKFLFIKSHFDLRPFSLKKTKFSCQPTKNFDLIIKNNYERKPLFHSQSCSLKIQMKHFFIQNLNAILILDPSKPYYFKSFSFANKEKIPFINLVSLETQSKAKFLLKMKGNLHRYISWSYFYTFIENKYGFEIKINLN